MSDKRNPEKKRRKGILIDVDYVIKNNETRVRLQMKGKSVYYLYDRYEPYFYLDAPKSKIPELMKAAAIHMGEKICPVRIEEIEKEVEGEKRKILKVYGKHPPHIPHLREALKKYPAYEYNILFGRRYMIDKGIGPLMKLTYERKGRRIVRILKTEEASPKFKMMSFDIETYNPVGMPRAEKDPIIMISYATGPTLMDAHVLTYKEVKGKEYAINCKDEKEMIEKFCEVVKKENPEIITGYNSTNFDLPYLQERAKKTKAKLALGRDGSSFTIRKRGIREVGKIRGRIYIDLYPLLRFLSFIGAVKLSRFTLEIAYSEIMGRESKWKKEMDRLNIWKMWDNGKLAELAEYSRIDAQATWELAKKVLPLELEMSKLTHVPPSDVIGSTSSQLVESLLIYEAYQKGMVVPNRAGEDEVKKRMENPIKGAFVKTPSPGIYENIMVFDFRGLYPSIIISHNIDPFTLVKEGKHCKEFYTSPTGAKFAKHPKGIVPYVLEKVITTRAELKDRLKKLKRDSEGYNAVFARQQSLKILANSYYGYLVYARSRYYSRECGESVTAWGRHFIMKTGEEAQKEGFELLYQDTDSAFLLLGNKTKNDAINWMKKINDNLPGTMELELEAYYPRGVFVSKKVTGKEGVTGAKKKYAMIDEKGRIKIRGFELVRRDWSAVAKETQKKVLEAILKDGSKEKAVKIVRKVVDEIKSGKMPLEKMVIETQLTKEISKYEVKSPELVAAIKANKRGKGEKIGQGSIVRYIITKTSRPVAELEKITSKKERKGKASKTSVSDKAEVADFAKDYDADYYIGHQIIPTVLKILKELGVTEDDLKLKGKQKGLGAFF
ncbi:MAG: DNA-directed DNA polymerase [Candidatus Micrarchaeota archaeon]